MDDKQLNQSQTLIQKANLKNFDVLPLLYVKNYHKDSPLLRWAIRLSQPVASKFIIVKTLNSMSSGDPNHYDDYGGEDDSGLQHGQFRLYGETIPVHNLN